MSLLVVGSVALDTVETPFGRAQDALGGSATFFAAAASWFCPVRLVGVIGDDFPAGSLDFLAEREVDLSGLEKAAGKSFRWAGVYNYDLSSRETLETRLGVFADFAPRIPDSFGDTEWVFLGNIDPELQIDVLKQIQKPRLVACDTMNFWIGGKRDTLLELLKEVDLLLVNDSEARELSGDFNLARAARWIQARGPRYVIIKKGEHGAILFTPDSVFFAPGFPLDEVFDPTGAGDAFAGGLMGYLARCGKA
ncbi:MAG: sugar kinase, partial [Gemmatimonadetes bacterium]|nr:sugar kinase [Gemmatimonadota bacterium]